MEEFSSQSNQNPIELVDELNNWIRPLQKALTIEAENRFRNLYGRNEHFNSFVSREISSFKSPLLAQEINEKSPTAIRFLKNAFHADTDGVTGLQILAGDLTMMYYTSDEAKEGRNAFLESKRQPDFKKFGRLPFHG